MKYGEHEHSDHSTIAVSKLPKLNAYGQQLVILWVFFFCISFVNKALLQQITYYVITRV